MIHRSAAQAGFNYEGWDRILLAAAYGVFRLACDLGMTLILRRLRTLLCLASLTAMMESPNVGVVPVYRFLYLRTEPSHAGCRPSDPHRPQRNYQCQTTCTLHALHALLALVNISRQ